MEIKKKRLTGIRMSKKDITTLKTMKLLNTYYIEQLNLTKIIFT